MLLAANLKVKVATRVSTMRLSAELGVLSYKSVLRETSCL